MTPAVLSSRRAEAGFDLAGTVCSVMGALYLAFDLFGRHAGPLGFFTRAATYSLLLTMIFWAGLGAAFGAIAGVGLGSLLAVEYWLLARRQRFMRSSPLFQPWWSGVARGVVLGLAVMPRFGLRFGASLMIAECGLLGLVYGAGLVPTFRFSAGRLVPPRAALRGAFYRALAMGAAAAAAAGLTGGLEAAERLGLLIALLSALSGVLLLSVIPYCEYWIETAPDRFFVTAGLVLLFAGLFFDAVPSVLVLLSEGP